MNYAAKQGTFGLLSALKVCRVPAVPAFAVLALLAALAYALRAIVTKASPGHLPLEMVLALQSAFLVPILGLMARRQKVSLAFSPKHVRPYAMRIVFGVLNIFVLYYTLRHLPAGLASTLGYSAPLFTALLAPLVLGEASTTVALLLTFVGFAGVGLNALPYLHDVSVALVGLGLLGGFFGAMLQVYLRKLALVGEPALRGVFWMHAITGVGAVAYCAFKGELHFTLPEMLGTFVLALLTCGGQLGSALAYQRGKAITVNALSFMTLPMTVLLAVVLLHEHVSSMALAGIALTLPACFGLVWHEQSRVKALHDQTDHELTLEEVREEHVALQNAVGAELEPLFATEPTEEELLTERRARPHCNAIGNPLSTCNTSHCNCLAAA